ncbi:carbamoyltransferase C-terminal domain-containing protein [Flavobacterium sp. YJ01]|uniref:carbamoyltransferase C-terminal domain-containing protein n=1 Tax=Flavobacterium sp. YJ01 TaxID=3031997 RepID=UPI0023E45768|nr:carbamoyltransferase C-terminal domain-containing protein [Flavobacterium sp. YJ01]WET03909.1 carbamoyltransferase C-terminal domain-containing protein [Flavobacterium sp. YJ01]
MKILSYNPGHDGSVVYLNDGKLVFSIEAEKNSNYRYSPISTPDILRAMGELDEIPDVISVGGWWPRDHHEYLYGSNVHAPYRGETLKDIIVEQSKLLGKEIHYFSSSHERSHLLCAIGMSELPKGTPCYALIWEGEIGAFYEIDSELNIFHISDVLTQVGNRYGLFYGLADPTFPIDGEYPRNQDAGKLMALASFSNRNNPTNEEKKILEFLLDGPYRKLSDYENIFASAHYHVGVDNSEFCNFAGIFSDRIFNIFYQFAKDNLKKKLPLVIAGGCGLNCDWNSKWKETGLFTEIFVPPVANDSGSAIGTAIDAQFYFTGNPKIDWDVYSGKYFDANCNINLDEYDILEATNEKVAEFLADDLILAWINGKYEIGPRALGNRSIIAAPFKESTKTRLNIIKQREQFRPIAPVCLEEDASRWFGCEKPSPYMLYTYVANTDALAAVTHVNKTARIQTVSSSSNKNLYNLLKAFKNRTGYGVLCNTSLNFNGKGFINKLDDLSLYTIQHKLDGFVVNEKIYILKSSTYYQNHLKKN